MVIPFVLWHQETTFALLTCKVSMEKILYQEQMAIIITTLEPPPPLVHMFLELLH